MYAQHSRLVFSLLHVIMYIYKYDTADHKTLNHVATLSS